MGDRPGEMQADRERLGQALRQIKALQRQIERHQQALDHLCPLVAWIALACLGIEDLPLPGLECRGEGQAMGMGEGEEREGDAEAQAQGRRCGQVARR